jgi:PleD family two-component response regulator
MAAVTTGGWTQAKTAGDTSAPCDALKALVVSNDAGAAEGERIKLELDGYDVVIVTDADAAIAAIKSGEQPDLVFLDASHAPIAPPRLAERLRAACGTSDIAILVIRPPGHGLHGEQDLAPRPHLDLVGR